MIRNLKWLAIVVSAWFAPGTAAAERLYLLCVDYRSSGDSTFMNFQALIINTEENAYFNRHFIHNSNVYVTSDNQGNPTRRDQTAIGPWYAGALGVAILPTMLRLKQVQFLRGVNINPELPIASNPFQVSINRQYGTMVVHRTILSSAEIPCKSFSELEFSTFFEGQTLPQFASEREWEF